MLSNVICAYDIMHTFKPYIVYGCGWIFKTNEVIVYAYDRCMQVFKPYAMRSCYCDICCDIVYML